MRAVITSTLLLCLCHAPQTQGGILERDWKAPGDGLLTYDTVNGREWLELTESVLTNFEGHSYQEHLDNAVAELEPGKLFEDFTWASPEDVQDLAVSAGIDLATEDYGTNGDPVRTVLDVLGITVVGIPRFTIGAVNDYQLAVFSYRSVQSPYARLQILPNLQGDLARLPHVGLMLYREAIPEPATVLLAATAIVLLLPIMRRGQRLRVGLPHDFN